MGNTFKNSLFNCHDYSCNRYVINHSVAITYSLPVAPSAVTILFYFSVTLLTISCKENYDPPLSVTETNFLVVEGFINAAGATDIILSRAIQLKDTQIIRMEPGALVTIMGEDNSIVPLTEDSSGHYQSARVSLSFNQKYRLSIKTAEGKEYQSDFLPVKRTPPIDSVNWRNENNGVNIYVNSHDEPNHSRYYKWTYEATWEIHSTFHVLLGYVNRDISARNFDEINRMFYCWHTENSANILLGSTSRLSENVISMIPIVNIPPYDEQLSVRYSIVVKQRALDKQEYDFYQVMKKNTETTGSVFGPLPTELFTNIHCTSNPGEKVIGYMTVTTEETSKRIFISNADVPGWNYQSKCVSVFIDNSTAAQYFENNDLIPYAIGYYASTRKCMDCRTRGSNVKPSFW